MAPLFQKLLKLNVFLNLFYIYDHSFNPIKKQKIKIFKNLFHNLKINLRKTELVSIN